MIDQSKRDTLKLGLATGLGATLVLHTTKATAQQLNGPSVQDTIQLLSSPLGVESLILRVKMLTPILAHIAEQNAGGSFQNELLEELKAANDGNSGTRTFFRRLYELRDDTTRRATIKSLKAFLGSPRATEVYDELNQLKGWVVEKISGANAAALDTPMVSYAIKSLYHVEHIVQSDQDLNSTNVLPLSWCELPLFRCYPSCNHQCSWW